uniref:Uncharacterized protein n=1 Tax=Setaria italica TaxID=4555 RepID=K4A480_SETIT
MHTLPFPLHSSANKVFCTSIYFINHICKRHNSKNVN